MKKKQPKDRNSKGQFIEGYGFWTGKKRPNLLDTGAAKTMFKKGLTPWNTGSSLAVDQKCKGCDIIMKVLPCYKERQKWHSRQCMAENAGYKGLHDWVRRVKGKPSLCEECGTITAKKYEWSNTSFEYKRDPSDWRRLCTSCHRHYDLENGWGRAKQKFNL